MRRLGRHFLDLPPIWALGIGAGAVLLGRLPPLGPFQDEFYGHFGLYMAIAGAAFAAWAAVWFHRRETTIEPWGEPVRLIVEGPFRINRNPIYTGMALMVFGANFAFGGPVGIAVCALFPFLVTRRFVAQEEETLLRLFGKDAERYLTTTRRW